VTHRSVAGAFGVLSVTVNLWAPRHIGFAATAGFTLAATLVAGLLLDAAGAFGIGARTPTPTRVCGAAVALGGALLSRHRPRAGEPNKAVLAVDPACDASPFEREAEGDCDGMLAGDAPLSDAPAASGLPQVELTTTAHSTP
jgi:hypothetical protein